MKRDIVIAALLTCHNRKEKTLLCLQSLFSSLYYYNSNYNALISLKVFLVDDGSTDGTSEEIQETFKDKIHLIKIIKGSGSLFWARGMALAWRYALDEDSGWDFFLLLNDDTFLYNNSLKTLFDTHKYSLNKFGKEGLYSGITCEMGNSEKITYGGAVWLNKFMVKCKQLKPSLVPQMCDVANANILLVPYGVVNQIGILNDTYQHGFADYEYSMSARKRNIPVLVTSEICGECNFDHDNEVTLFIDMNLKERKAYFNSPLHSNKDYLYYIKRNFPIRFPFVLIGRLLNLYFPKIYYYTRELRK